jgi:hypothetical protein
MNGRPIALGYPPEAERMVVPRTDAVDAPMTDRQARAAENQQKSLDAFLAGKARFDAMVAERQKMSAERFGADPEAVLWGEHGTLRHWNELLAQVTDAYSRRGEWAG